MSTTDTTVERDVEESRLLVGAIQKRDSKTSHYVWRLADLAAKNTHRGRPKKVPADGNLFTAEEWAEKIDWLAQGNSVRYLQHLIQESRSWPKHLRVEKRTIEQHRDARAAHDTVEAAHLWLTGLKGVSNIRDRARTIDEITGSGPVYEARLKLWRIRKLIISIPAKLAKSPILGNEASFPLFQRDLERVREALAYLDRYIADETIIDREALDEALDRILAGEEA